MAQEITLRIEDDAEAALLFDKIAVKWKYTDTVGEPPVQNPETKKDFIARLLSEFLISEGVQGYHQEGEDIRRSEIEAITIVRI